MNQSIARFPSFAELQSAHDELLGQQDSLDGSVKAQSEFWAEVQTFVVRARETGALLDISRDRRAAIAPQSIVEEGQFD